jgi:predicted Zn-dependent protease
VTETAPQELVERALAASKADDCIVIATSRQSANLRWANNTLTTNGVIGATELTVISIVSDGGTPRAASLSRTGVTVDRVEDLVEASRAAAAAAPPAEDAAPLIEAAAGSGSGWDDEPIATGGGDLAPVASGLAAAFDAARGRDEGRYGYAEHTASTVYVGSSRGLRLRDAQGDGRLELTGRSADGSRSAWAGLHAETASGLDVASLERSVAQRLDWSKQRRELPAGRYPTILPPSAVSDLLVYAYWSMGGLDAHEGSTVFSKAGGGTRVGERLADLPLRMWSDPAAAGLACTPFVVAGASSRLSSVFDNGLPLQSTDWIADGELRALLQTRHSAARTDLPVTPFIDNLGLEAPGATDSLDDIIRSTDRGLLLTCLWYIREVDPQTLLLTGLTRDGVFLVEGGEVVGAVNNFRFNESPVGMLRRIDAVGRSEGTLPREWGDYFSRASMPPLRIKDFNMSSVSQAS